MTNFDFLKFEPQFESFAETAVSAERIFHIDTTLSVMACRKAMENAVKWMYSVDKDLKMPYDTTLVALMNTESFRDIVDDDVFKRMEFIRKTGNIAAHSRKKISLEQAKLCIENLFYFLDFVAYCYGKNYQEQTYHREYLNPLHEAVIVDKAELEQNIKNSESHTLNLHYVGFDYARQRKHRWQTYVPKPLELSEFKTRKIYIDTMLQDAGWAENENWMNEVELPGMPNKSEVGYADYVLYDDTHKPLAVIEAKRTCVDVSKGRQQAKLYADILEKQYGRRPVIFLTNGFETRIDDGQYPERKVAAIYSKRDLEKLFNLRKIRTSLKNVMIDKNIAGRYYQESAIKEVCDALDNKNRRKALLVMATGSGKTRTVIALCKVLAEHNWIKNILFFGGQNLACYTGEACFCEFISRFICYKFV